MLGCQYKASSKSQDSETVEHEEMLEGKQIEGSDLFEFEHFKLQKVSSVTLDPLEKKTVSVIVGDCLRRLIYYSVL